MRISATVRASVKEAVKELAVQEGFSESEMVQRLLEKAVVAWPRKSKEKVS